MTDLFEFKRGSTSQTIKLNLKSSLLGSTLGGLTGLLFNSTGLTAYYIREGDASPTQISLVTATLGTWTSGGFKEVSASNNPGLYELGLPNAALAQGKFVDITIKGPALLNLMQADIHIDLVAYEPQDAASLGLSRIDTAISTRSTFSGTNVSVDLTQAVPVSNTSNTIGDCLNAARSVGFGAWEIVGNQWILYAPDGTTIIKQFTVDSNSQPSKRG